MKAVGVVSSSHGNGRRSLEPVRTSWNRDGNRPIDREKKWEGGGTEDRMDSRVKGKAGSRAEGRLQGSFVAPSGKCKHHAAYAVTLRCAVPTLPVP